MSGFFGGSSSSPLTILSRDYTATQIDSATGGILVSYTLPAGTLGATGLIWLRTVWAYVTSGEGISGRINANLSFGGVPFVTSPNQCPSTSGGGNIYLDWYVAALNSTDAQACYGQRNAGVFESSGPGVIGVTPLASTGGYTYQFTLDSLNDPIALEIDMVPFGPGDGSTTITQLVTEVFRIQ